MQLHPRQRLRRHSVARNVVERLGLSLRPNLQETDSSFPLKIQGRSVATCKVL
jgi:hypothetical protein